MIIDFHAHMFPDKIVKTTIEYLAGICKMGPFTDGTVDGLKRTMKGAGIDTSVVLPIVTNPKQFHTINEFASRYQEGELISFGSVHPLEDNYKEQLRYIKSLGLKGIKFHPDYQNVYFNDIHYKRVIAYAAELDLIVSVHAGMDPKSPVDIHCTPKMSMEVLDDVKPPKLILAHMGGNAQWDDVERYLVGRDVYFDTGVVLDKMPREQFLRMVKNHGADRILFGTDAPWGEPAKYVQILKDMPLTEEEREKIFAENACRLLGL